MSSAVRSVQSPEFGFEPLARSTRRLTCTPHFLIYGQRHRGGPWSAKSRVSSTDTQKSWWTKEIPLRSNPGIVAPPRIDIMAGKALSKCKVTFSSVAPLNPWTGHNLAILLGSSNAELEVGHCLPTACRKPTMELDDECIILRDSSVPNVLAQCIAAVATLANDTVPRPDR
ncbi:hypothetical protein CYLTODRAFT_443820 [Cylindrobasidium torrendii FP15055 ss-10]|uniref:Uncharacterized protein n=1 Tax=Cylindrobasidium torrendii FP15055 ss-10 TaxID=1314674 RepID=A0A0D7BBX5_9AGAR|nr:hypothetical protein CYLTODRAFT_443820 [Cylindrobasidium torrendii FP15055 ss-10]